MRKDIIVEVNIRSKEKERAIVNLVIGGLIRVKGFKIVEGDDKKLYVINPHSVKTVYNKLEMEKEVRYYSTANLLEHKDRKKIIQKIVAEYGRQLDELVKKANEITGAKNINLDNGATSTIRVKLDEEDKIY